MTPRLKTILRYVRGDVPPYDLCCDHGLLGLSAWEERDLPQLHLIDQSPRVMQKLQGNLLHRGLASEPRIKLQTLPAEQLTLPFESCDIVIAGVGVQTMIDIMAAIFSEGLSQHRLILGCQQKTQELRFYLRRRGFKLVDEDVVLENGRFREILVLEGQGEEVTLYGERYRQRSDTTSKAFVLYLQNYYAKIQVAKNQGSRIRTAWSALEA